MEKNQSEPEWLGEFRAKLAAFQKDADLIFIRARKLGRPIHSHVCEMMVQGHDMDVIRYFLDHAEADSLGCQES